MQPRVETDKNNNNGQNSRLVFVSFLFLCSYFVGASWLLVLVRLTPLCIYRASTIYQAKWQLSDTPTHCACTHSRVYDCRISNQLQHMKHELHCANMRDAPRAIATR